MKKTAIIFLSMMCFVFSAIGLTACGQEHEHDLKKVSEVSATCSAEGNTAYYVCECGKYFSNAEGVNEIEKDSWITPATGHSLQRVSATSPTCTTLGNVEYYYCACGKYFSDAEGTNEILENSWNIPMVAHSYDSEPTYQVEDGKAYEIRGCSCSKVQKTEVEGAIIVNSTETVQQALDQATENNIIVLDDANYDVLYLRKNTNSTLVADDGNWAGGGHTYARTISNLKIISCSGAVVKQIKAEVGQYTPSGVQHSNSATEPYLTLRLTLNNLTLVNLNFELENDDVAVDVLYKNSKVDGLNIIGCRFVDKDASSTIASGNRILNADQQGLENCVKNVVVSRCYAKDLHQAIKINCLENITISNNTFVGIKAHTIIFSGGSASNLNKSGKIEITDNRVTQSMGERFIRATCVSDNAEIIVKNNTIVSGIPMGSDEDVVKITDVSEKATVTIDNSNSWNGKTVTVDTITTD